MHVVLCVPGDERSPWLDLLRAALPGAEVSFRDNDEPADPDAPQADYVVTGWRSATLFDEQRRMKAIFTLSAGVGHLRTLPNLPRHVPLVRLEDAGMAGQMIRYVLAAALRFAQRIDAYARQQREAKWAQHEPRPPSAVRVGVIGLGVIGTKIARALAAQGFAVRGFARGPKDLDGVEVFAGGVQFDAFLRGLDIVVSVVPDTPDTRGMLNRRSLAHMADGGHVVNIGRGAVLVEDDLLALLDSGKLSGATLDVFREEPLPAAHPFWRRPDIQVTPHISGLTVPDAAVAQVAGKIAALERGEAVSGIVEWERGY
jgi:glyoxylate/hydroxypyruvate reductase A